MIYKNKGPPRSSVTILPWIKVVDEISDLRVAGNIDRISFVVLSCYYLFILTLVMCCRIFLIHQLLFVELCGFQNFLH